MVVLLASKSASASLRLDVGTADRTKPHSHNETIAQPLYTILKQIFELQSNRHIYRGRFSQY